MNIIGIDPGLSGGIACIDKNGTIDLFVMPTIQVSGKKKKREIWCQNVAEILTGIPEPKRVYMEKVSAMPGQGVTGMFNFGMGYGMLRGIIATLQIPYELVRPQEWQKVVLKGFAKGSEILVATQLYPRGEFIPPRCRVHHSGLIDAALIATYGQRVYQG